MKLSKHHQRIKNPYHHRRRYAYVLDNIVEKNPEYISPEIEKMAKDFIKKSEKSAKSLADGDDEEEFLEFLEDAILAGPQFGNVASGDLLELLMRNQVMGTIPLADLKAEELIRGDKIDVYDYLQAALQHLVERVALMWLRGEVTQRQKEIQQDKTETVVERKPSQQQQQQVGGSTHRFATVRIDGKEY